MSHIRLTTTVAGPATALLLFVWQGTGLNTTDWAKTSGVCIRPRVYRFPGLRPGGTEKGSPDKMTLPGCLATRVGAQVALQRCLYVARTPYLLSSRMKSEKLATLGFGGGGPKSPPDGPLVIV